MRGLKPGKHDTATGAELGVLLGTALLMLLLTGQCLPVSGNLASRLVFENDPGLPGAEPAEKESSALALTAILDAPALQLPQNFRYHAEPGSGSVGDEIHASFSDIRAPPHLS